MPSMIIMSHFSINLVLVEYIRWTVGFIWPASCTFSFCDNFVYTTLFCLQIALVLRILFILMIWNGNKIWLKKIRMNLRRRNLGIQSRKWIEQLNERQRRCFGTTTRCFLTFHQLLVWHFVSMWCFKDISHISLFTASKARLGL